MFDKEYLMLLLSLFPIRYWQLLKKIKCSEGQQNNTNSAKMDAELTSLSSFV